MSSSETSAHAAAEPWWWPASRVARAIAARELSAVEYLGLMLDRVRTHDPELGLVVTVDERAQAAAEAADAAVAAGEPLGPLHGVAMTVKDCLATRGLRTTAGMTELANHVPRADAAVVAALRRAGAIVYGKTNTPAGVADVQTYNELFGVSRNPWHPGFSTGGSSGGSAGAVAAGFTPVEVGSDVAGSIRLPASACGVFGHKPSFGLVPSYGHLPPPNRPPAITDMSVIGPLARSVDDLELMFSLMCGPSPWDEPAWRVCPPPARPVRRVAAWFDDPYCPVDREVVAALEHAAGLLADSGVVVDRVAPRGIDLAACDQVFQRLLASSAGVPGHSPEQIGLIGAGLDTPGAGLGARHVAQSHHEWLDADATRTHLRERWRLFFTRYDAALLPVAPNLAIPHDHRPFTDRRIVVNGTERPYWDQIVWAGLTGMAYLPTTVLPVRSDSRGLPIGVAVVGPYLHDRTTLAVARALATVIPPLGRPARLEPKGVPSR